jgi:hypothetical protein
MNGNGSLLNENESCAIIYETPPDDRGFWLAQREALLMWLDAIERRLGIEPRTAQLRREQREARIAGR